MYFLINMHLNRNDCLWCFHFKTGVIMNVTWLKQWITCGLPSRLCIESLSSRTCRIRSTQYFTENKQQQSISYKIIYKPNNLLLASSLGLRIRKIRLFISKEQCVFIYFYPLLTIKKFLNPTWLELATVTWAFTI